MVRKKFGWKPEENNNLLCTSSIDNKIVPITYKLDIGTSVFDQGELGSCTSNAIISAYAYLKKKMNFYTADFIYITNKEN